MSESYQVRACGVVLSTHNTEAEAIAAAETLPDEDCPSVQMLVEDGTYRSATRIWPTVSETHTD